MLEELDTLPADGTEAAGLRVNNANFFALDDFASVDSADLYSRLLSKFPAWLRERRSFNREALARNLFIDETENKPPAPAAVRSSKPSSSKDSRLKGKVVARYMGTGDDVISDVHADEGVYRLHVVYQGKEDINVSVYYANDDMNWLISSYGEYDGYVLVRGASPFTFEIQSSGHWQIELEKVPQTKVNCFSGEGDDITDIFAASSRVWHIIHEGRENFDVAVHFVKRGDTDWLVSKDGRYEGKMRFVIPRGDTAYFEVKADGRWSIEPI